MSRDDMVLAHRGYLLSLERVSSFRLPSVKDQRERPMTITIHSSTRSRVETAAPGAPSVNPYGRAALHARRVVAGARKGFALVGCLVAVALTSCAPSRGSVASGPGGTPGQYTSNGQRIYLTATSASGNPITYAGGPGSGMMQGGLACVSCHGPAGHGGQVTQMMTTFEAPNITWSALSMVGAMDHAPYTVETLKQAITAGVDPAGKALTAPMPQWRMSAPDLDDLVTYLKTLR